jgi:hypothetical protein
MQSVDNRVAGSLVALKQQASVAVRQLTEHLGALKVATICRSFFLNRRPAIKLHVQQGVTILGLM